MKLKYGIIGSGAIGGFFGGKLVKGGKDVHFLFHSDYSYVKEHGLKIESINGDFEVNPIQAYNKTSDMPKCDIVFVCLKTTNNKLLKTLLPPLLHENSVVILLQNGLEMEADLAKQFPNLQIAGGISFICSSKIAQGRIGHFDQGTISIGSYSCKNTAILEQINSDFKESGVECNIVDLELARWKKLIWNIPYNGMTVVLNTKTDYLMKNKDSRSLIRDLMLEMIRGANHVGKGRFQIDESLAETMMKRTDNMTPYSPSMKLDFDNKRPLEVEYIYNRAIIEAEEAGFDMPKTKMLAQQLLFIQDQYKNG